MSDSQQLSPKPIDINDNLEAEMESLIYTLSHDMRAPFVTLCGLVDEVTMLTDDMTNLLVDIIPELEADKQERMQYIVDDMPEIKSYIDQSVSQLDTYLQDLLTLSRLSRRDFHKQTLTSLHILEAVWNELDPLCDNGTLKIESEDQLPECYADRETLSEIFHHIIRNALQYRHASRPCTLTISGTVDNDKVHFQIMDNGRGISDFHQQKIFDPFYRVGWDDVDGRGMGLTYARKLVRLMDGTIWCQSIENIGTTIHILMPKN